MGKGQSFPQFSVVAAAILTTAKLSLMLLLFGTVLVNEIEATAKTTICLKPTSRQNVVGLDMLFDSKKRLLSSQSSSFIHSLCWVSTSSALNANYDDDAETKMLEEHQDPIFLVNDDNGHTKLNEFIQHLKEISYGSRCAIRLLSPSFLIASRSRLRRNNSANQTITNENDDGKSSAPKVNNYYVDLSGLWKPIVTPQFKIDFHNYLVNCSVSYWHRKLLMKALSFQTHQIIQYDVHDDNGQPTTLTIMDQTPVGSWGRTLLAFKNTTLIDPHGDQIEIESWWEMNTTSSIEDEEQHHPSRHHHGDRHFSIHKSIVRGKPSFQGGTVETSRYVVKNHEEESTDGSITNHRDILICESTFHPGPNAPLSFKHAEIVFRFQRLLPSSLSSSSATAAT